MCQTKKPYTSAGTFHVGHRALQLALHQSVESIADTIYYANP